MIREAHVGIAILGKEGRQAARSSDYAIGMVRAFRQEFTLEDAIEFHAFALLEALPCV
jgi:magnesium-transporting ATPase (P-type)